MSDEKPTVDLGGCGCAAMILAIAITWNIAAILDCFEDRFEHDDLKARIEALEKNRVTPQELEYLGGIVFPEIEDATRTETQ
jgi:hypothetical protein